MGSFNFISLWVFQDLLIYAIGFATLVFILRHEERPQSIIAELIAFCFFNAAVFENFATLMGWYGYGRSLIMVFNVSLSVPLVEWLVIYTTLRLLAGRKMPTWSKPLVVGFSGMLFDFTLDPLAIRQVFQTAEGRIGRWSWYPGTADVQLGGEPVYNFTGWILLCGYFTATILAGRYWHRLSGWNGAIGLAYPFAAAIAALAILVSPISNFLLWLGPFMAKGSAGEWIMLVVLGALGLFVLLAFGRGRRSESVPPVFEFPALLVLAGLPLFNLLLCVLEGYTEALPLVAPAAIAEAGLVAAWFFQEKAAVAKGKLAP
ncbi:MAG TPA: hypothetical protein VMV83_15720 [Rectinemataceae bacterium]|nr:hypothetical protein [Rectinemataceae bacterium]